MVIPALILLAFDSEGRVFVCYIDYIEDGSAGCGIYGRSDDGGVYLE